MKTDFFRESVKIASDYIQSITFIDDQLRSIIDNDHDIAFNEITKAFAETGKACTFFDFKSIEEKNSILKLIHNSDVCVLDWKLIELKKDLQQISEDQAEEDAEENSDRGKNAKEILRSIVNSSIDSPKLIIIYTAERDINIVYSPLKKVVGTDSVFNDEDLSIQNNNTRITVYFKPSLKNALTDEISKKSIAWLDLPRIINEEFTKITGGLVSNTILKAISIIRKNTNKLMQLYNKNLDKAFLLNRALSPNPDETNILLRNAIINSIDSIFSYENITGSCEIEMIKKWLETNSYEEREISINKNNKKKVKITDIYRKEWLTRGYKDFINYVLVENGKQKLSDDELNNYDRNSLLKDANDCFCPNLDSSEDFAILTHHKSNHKKPAYIPHLTMGVVIQRRNDYYLCIQQRCDSIRIDKGESRKFLFLPLEESNKRFSIVFKNQQNKYINLKVGNKNSQDLTILVFPETGNGSVLAKNRQGYFRFYTVDNVGYKWLLDLNDSYTQKIVNEYSAAMSRVGLIESEWLRRS